MGVDSKTPGLCFSNQSQNSREGVLASSSSLILDITSLFRNEEGFSIQKPFFRIKLYALLLVYMKQMDLFEETLEKKIHRLEKWISRLQKEMWWLKNIHEMSMKLKKIDSSEEAYPRNSQIVMFE